MQAPIAPQRITLSVSRQKTEKPTLSHKDIQSVIGELQGKVIKIEDVSPEKEALLATLNGGVIGQAEACEQIADIVDTGLNRVLHKKGPLGVAFLSGPTGVGKTETVRMLAKHSNNTRWKVETLGAQIDLDTRGQDFIKRTEKRLGRPLEVYDMKPYIRNSTHKSLKLPKVMKESITELMQSGDTSYWTWAVGIIILGKDEDLKNLMKKRILEDGVLSNVGFLNILTQTQILRGEGTIFELDTHEESGNISMKLSCKGVIIAKSKGTLKGSSDIRQLKHSCRTKLIEELFDYYIKENNAERNNI